MEMQLEALKRTKDELREEQRRGGEKVQAAVEAGAPGCTGT